MHSNELLTSNVAKLYRKYLLPTLIGVVSNTLYCLVDVYFIAKGSGNLGLAALNIAMPIFTIYSAIGLTFGVGSATIMSIAEGNKDQTTRNKAFCTGMFFMIGLGFIFTILTNLYLSDFAYLLGSSEPLLPYVMAYLRPICMSAIPFIIMYATSILLRSDHNPKLAMYALMTGNFANIFLDYLFVMVFGWGIFGASFATALFPIITLLMASLHFFKKQHSVHYQKHFLQKALIKRMIKNGIGSGLMEISAGTVIVIFNAVILMISNETYLAAFSIITNIAYVLKGILNGFAQAAQPIISTNYGANKKERTKLAFQQSLQYSTLFSIAIYIVFLIFPRIVALPFANGDEQLISISINGIRLYFTCTIFLSLNIMIMYYYQAIELGNYATILAILKGFIFIVIALLSLVPLFQINGIWLSITMAEVLSLLCAYYLLCKRQK
ncbi:MAG: MATE family efflux transporter [Erysipelotrichia bacterium]|nr:MATE family efflux transporter [Erysipelotrichia bacterium]NCC53894.1 MATE family efflux transporter [Erysipelotrichia bacterium]